MRANLAALCLSTVGVLSGAALCSPQAQAQAQTQSAIAPAADSGYIGQPGYSSIYCSGFVRDSRVPEDLRIVAGEEAAYKIVFTTPDHVYLNQGSNKGLKVGDRLMVVRPDEDPAKSQWFSGQFRIRDSMALLYRDLGQLRVVNVQPKISVAEVIFSCTYMQRGDIVRPYEERPAPPLKDGALDHFAPISGKPVGVIVSGLDHIQAPAKGSIMYINLGAAKGIKIGDYVRVFRYQGELRETVPVTKNTQYEMTGFGSSPKRYEPKDLPREVLGEGIVLNASRNAATVMVTFTSGSVYAGDYVEIE
jgi:hypothetical protein